MPVSFHATRIAANTSPGNQDFTIPGMGTPKAVVVIVTASTVFTPGADGAAISYGIATGTGNRFCIGSSSQDNIASANCKNIKSNTRCLLLLNQDSTINAEADFVSFDPAGVNGVRLNWIDAPTTAVAVTVIFVVGTDLSAFAGDFLASGSVETDTVVTDPAFPPDQLIVLGSHNAAYNAVANHASMQIGFVSRGTPITQCSSNWWARFNSATNANSEGHNFISTDRASVGVNPLSGAPALGQNAIEITLFAATGFTARTKTAGLAVRYPYLALSYTSGNGTCPHSVSVVDSPSAPGTITHPSTFQPQFVMKLPTGVNIVNADRIAGTNNAPGAGTYGVCAFEASSIVSYCLSDDDAAGTMNTQSFSTTDLRCRSDIQTNLHIATFSSFSPSGWTMTYSVAVSGPAAAPSRKWPAMVVGEFAATGQGIPVKQYQYRQRRAW
jgi:hypothetical protein